jgi:hypothetical protein
MAAAGKTKDEIMIRLHRTQLAIEMKARALGLTLKRRRKGRPT